MGKFTDQISGNELSAFFKKGLIADGVAMEETVVTMRRAGQYSCDYIITIEDDDIFGNEEEWAWREEKETQKQAKGFLIVFGLFAIAIFAAAFIGAYVIPYFYGPA